MARVVRGEKEERPIMPSYFYPELMAATARFILFKNDFGASFLTLESYKNIELCPIF